MKLQTNITLEPKSPQIDYHSEVVMLGSCFTRNIGEKLDYFKFRNLQNPFGIIFHPAPIHGLIDRAVNRRYFTIDDIFEQKGIWHCLEVHSLVNETEPLAYLKLLNDSLDRFKAQLEHATHLVLTYGTAWGYRYKKTGAIVANCHKIPQKEFSKELNSVNEVETILRRSISAFRSVNSKAAIILTVSPVRHLKDGFMENARSKAHLISAVHQLADETELVYYFPSYEIMMDELRDYRFYSDDMLHPNRTAIEIIWEHFSQSWISSETLPIQKEIAAIQSALLHNPLNPDSEAHTEFLRQLQKKKESLQQRFPKLRF